MTEYNVIRQGNAVYVCMHVCMYVCRLHCPSSGYNAICQGTLPCLQDYITLIQGTMLFVRYSSVHSRLQDPSSGYNVVLQGTLPCLQGYITLVQGTMPFVRVMLYVYACMYVCRLHCPSSGAICHGTLPSLDYITLIQGTVRYISVPSRLQDPSSGYNVVLQGTLPCLQGYITLLQGPAIKATLPLFRVYNAIRQGNAVCVCMYACMYVGCIALLQGTMPFVRVHCPAYKTTLPLWHILQGPCLK